MSFSIGKKTFEADSPVFFIGELSANHAQDINLAIDTIHAMKESGVDAVKVQTYTPDTMTLDCDNDFFRINHGTQWDGKTLYDLYKQAYMPWDWHYKLKTEAQKLDMEFFSTPFDKSAVDFLEQLEVPAYKVASFEITDIPLIEYIASKGKPILLSTGVAELSDIKKALSVCERKSNQNVVLLKCVSSYPAPYDEFNLNVLTDMRKRFKCIVGLSDHTLTNSVVFAAVALGAKVIEKHVVLNKKIDTPDAFFSVEPKQYKEMIQAVRDVEKSLGKVTYSLSEDSRKKREFARSLFFVEDLKRGDIISDKNVRSIRPAYGLPPVEFEKVCGRRVTQDVVRGTPLKWDFISDAKELKNE